MAWNNSGISRLVKEQRITRNKQFAKLKKNEVADDGTVAALTGTVATNTAAITEVSNASVKTLIIEGNADWWATNTLTAMDINTSVINMRNVQILEVRAEMWETGHATLTPSNISLPGISMYIGLSGTADQDGQIAIFNFLGVYNTAGTGVAVRTAQMICQTKNGGESNFNPYTPLIPLKIISTGAWPTLNANWKLRLQISYIALPEYTYA